MSGPAALRVWYIANLTLCNFDCAYCASGVPGRGGARTRDVEWGSDDGLNHYNRVLDWLTRQRYQIGLRLQTIGEPMVSRNFLRGAARMSRAANIEFVELVTNGSLLRKRLPRLIDDYDADPRKLALWVTHHFDEISTAALLDQVCYARDRGLSVIVNTLLFPDSADAVRQTADACAAENIPLNVDIGHNFNQAYGDESFFPVADKPVASLLKDLGVEERAVRTTFVAAAAPQGLPCAAGAQYIHITPKGNVFPCRNYRLQGRRALLGSALDKDFVLNLRTEPYAPCRATKPCTCKEDYLNLRNAREAEAPQAMSLSLPHDGAQDVKLDAEVVRRLAKYENLQAIKMFAAANGR